VALFAGIALGCGSKKNVTEVSPVVQISKNYWAFSLGKVHRTAMRNGQMSANDLQDIFIACLAYDTALEYGDGYTETEWQWSRLRDLKADGALSQEMLNDPLGLDDYYKKNPNKYPMVLNLSQQTVGSKSAYDDFVEWFVNKIND
jgi:hypothetical protein